MDPSASRRELPAHVPALDGMRGILTFLVLVQHVFGAVLYTVSPQDAARWKSEVVLAQGVAVALPVYFVISGFVIFLPAARTDGRLGDLSWYAVRRIVRIVPAYYLSIAVLLLVWPFLFSDVPSPMATRRGVELVLGHVTFLHSMLYDETDIGFGLNGSVWTLTIEECFYASIPFAAPWIYRYPFRTLAASLAISIGWRLGSFYVPEIANALGASAPDPLLPSHLFHQFPGYLSAFAFGSVAARLYVQYWDAPFLSKRAKTLHVVHGACFVAIGLLMWRVGRIGRVERNIVPDITHDILPAALFAVMVLAVALGPPGPQKIYDNFIGRFLGDTSYGVYLWHMVLIQIVYRHAGLPYPPNGRSIAVYAAWVVPGSLALGWLSFRFFERPLSQWARKVRRALRASRTQAPST